MLRLYQLFFFEMRGQAFAVLFPCQAEPHALQLSAATYWLWQCVIGCPGYVAPGEKAGETYQRKELQPGKHFFSFLINRLSNDFFLFIASVKYQKMLTSMGHNAKASSFPIRELNSVSALSVFWVYLFSSLYLEKRKVDTFYE